MSAEPEDLRARLNLETSRIGWRELQTFYARGQVVRVTADLDLLEVAGQLAADNRQLFESWLAEGQVGDVSPELASAWYAREAELWAVVIAPWVLVQDRQDPGLH